MPSTGVIDGTDILLQIDVSGTLTPISHLTTQDFNVDVDEKERSSKDTGNYKNKRPGKIGQSINFECISMYDGYSYWDLYALVMARTVFTFKYGGHSDATREGNLEQVGDKYFDGKGFIKNLKRNDNDGEDSIASGSITISEEPTVETVSA